MNPYLNATATADPGFSTDAISSNSPASPSVHPSQGKPKSRQRRLPTQDLADLTSQLAIMTRSGVDLSSALQSLARQTKRQSIAQVLEGIHDQVMAGKSFSEALREYRASFGPTYVAMVAAGEASGKMSYVLQQLSKLQRNELQLTRTVRTLVAYPVLLAGVSGMVIVALVLFVLPRFSDMFAQNDLPLPLLTQVLLAISSELTGHWYVWLPLFLLTVGGGMAFRLSPRGKALWDSILINAPYIKSVSRTLIMGRICRVLGLMLDSGVPLLDSLALVRETCTNGAFQKLFADLEADVINGLGLSPTLKSTTIVPPSAAEMLTTAERTGNLGEVSRLIGEAYEEDTEARLKQTVAVVEPLITVGMGVIVAIVILAVMLPVFDMATFAGR